MKRYARYAGPACWRTGTGYIAGNGMTRLCVCAIVTGTAVSIYEMNGVHTTMKRCAAKYRQRKEAAV